jgi:hypothetical protein
MRLVIAALLLALLLAGCGGGASDGGVQTEAGAEAYRYPPAPDVEQTPLGPRIEAALSALAQAALEGDLDREALGVITATRDARLGWLISDYLRFASPDAAADFVDGFEGLTGVDPSKDPAFAESPWRSVTNHLIAWDLPAPPGYRERKAELFLAVEPAWAPFFEDADSKIDWRLVSWGGVAIDARPAGDPAPCPRGCIPALDDPALTPAGEGDWYPDDSTVFGVVAGGQAVAFPKNVMEVHELVNVTIGGRRLGIPYCTLCGSAQAYFLDSVPAGVEVPVLRTSGLLSRSNKVMYDLRSSSVFDTFTGEALSGPLQEAGLRLPQATVVAGSWGAWKDAHPGTLIVAEDGGVGREYPADPLGGRDDEGPIFPIGDVDPRLPVQELVVGVIAPGGRPVAFPAEAARAALEGRETITFSGVEASADGGGLRIRTRSGRELPAHQAFWFAWSQFHPRTALWTPEGA